MDSSRTTRGGGVRGHHAQLPRPRRPGVLRAGGNGRDKRHHRHGQHARLRLPTVIRLVCDALRHWVTTFVSTASGSTWPACWAGRTPARSTPSLPAHRDHHRPGALDRQADRRPWDRTGEGYRVGGFGWPGRSGMPLPRRGARLLRATAASARCSRLTGSSDLYASRAAGRGRRSTRHRARRFTLRDLVSYDRKHNEANGESNPTAPTTPVAELRRRGRSTSPVVRERRAATARRCNATLLLSTAHPWCGRRRARRTQGGNNNAYCLDDETTWVDWTPDARRGMMTRSRQRL